MEHQQRLLISTAAIGTPLAAYLVIGNFTAAGNTYSLATSLDTLIPFSLGWVLPYIYMYVSSVAPVCAIKDRRLLIRWAAAVALMYVVATPIWVFYPVSVPRAPLLGDDYYSYLLTIIQTLDPPTNCFPSMHVAVATLGALVVRRVDKIVGSILLATVLPIWYSTVAVQQHWVVDGAAGLLLAVCTYLLVYRRVDLPPEARERLPRVVHLAWVALLVSALAGLYGMWLLGIH